MMIFHRNHTTERLLIMKISAILVLLVAAWANVNALRIRKPPLGCENCKKGQFCVRDDQIACIKTPCPRHKCISPKPGKCPAPISGIYGICIARCTYDHECKGTMKCCGSCPRECTPPVITRCTPKCKAGYVCALKFVECVKPPCAPVYDCVSTKPKPGVCPKTQALIVRCRYDSQCTGTLKCCNGKCLASVSRPGRCPFEKLKLCPVSKKHACKRDSDCKQPMKCCGSCYKRCVMPMVETKRGLCPVPRGKCIVSNNPRNQCKNDAMCKGDDKCCRDVCGNLACLDPIKKTLG